MSNNFTDSRKAEVYTAKEISPPQKVYAFKDLPKEIQEKILSLQNTDGEFLRTSEKSAVLAQVIFLFLLLNIFGGFVSAFDISDIDAGKAVVFSIGFILFAFWIVYFGRNVYRIFKSPIKNHSYLTPTQLIETRDGTVKYRELKDVVEIVLDKVTNRAASGGSDYILKLKFDDGDSCEYPFERWGKEHFAEAEQWREKAVFWRDEAVGAAKRGDTNYFESRDIISKSATANLPVFEKSSRFLFMSPRLMFKITFAVFCIGITAYAVVKLSGLAK